MNAKPKWKSTEFWLTAIASIVGLLLASGVIEPGTSLDKGLGAVILGLTALGYNVNRGAIKSREKGVKPGWKTTEFWLTAASSGAGLVTLGADGEGNQIAGAIGAGLATLGYPPARALAKKNACWLLGALLLAGCAKSFDTRAQNATYLAVAPEYRLYVSKDPVMAKDYKARRLRTVLTWAKRLRRPDKEIAALEQEIARLEK